MYFDKKKQLFLKPPFCLAFSYLESVLHPGARPTRQTRLLLHVLRKMRANATLQASLQKVAVAYHTIHAFFFLFF